MEALTLDWPRQTLLLEKPGTGIYDLQTALDATALGIESEVRTFGFSPSGENMLLATNDSSRLWKRESRQIG